MWVVCGDFLGVINVGCSRLEELDVVCPSGPSKTSCSSTSLSSET